MLGAVTSRYALDSIVGRGSSLAVFADYALLMTLGVLLALVAPLGLPEVGNRIVADFVRSGNTASIRSYLRLSTFLAVALGFILAALTGLLTDALMDQPASFAIALIVIVPSIAFLNARRAQSLQLGGGNPVLFAPALSTGGSAAALAAVSFTQDMSLIVVALSVAVGNVVTALTVCRTHLQDSQDSGERASLHEQFQWLRTGSSAVANAMGTVILTQGDIIVVGLFASATETGSYAAASRLALVVTLALGGLTPREAPILGRLVAHQDFSGAWAHYRGASRLSGATGAAICVVLVFGGAHLLELFIPGSGMAHPWLAILAVGRLGSAVVGPAADLLIALDAQALAARSSWIGVVIAVLLMVLLGHALGPLGIAIGTTIGMLTRSLLHYVFARNRCLNYRLAANPR